MDRRRGPEKERERERGYKGEQQEEESPEMRRDGWKDNVRGEKDGPSQ